MSSRHSHTPALLTCQDVCAHLCVCVNRHGCQPPDGDPSVLLGELSYLESRSLGLDVKGRTQQRRSEKYKRKEEVTKNGEKGLPAWQGEILS